MNRQPHGGQDNGSTFIDDLPVLVRSAYPETASTPIVRPVWASRPPMEAGAAPPCSASRSARWWGTSGTTSSTTSACTVGVYRRSELSPSRSSDCGHVSSRQAAAARKSRSIPPCPKPRGGSGGRSAC